MQSDAPRCGNCKHYEPCAFGDIGHCRYEADFPSWVSYTLNIMRPELGEGCPCHTPKEPAE